MAILAEIRMDPRTSSSLDRCVIATTELQFQKQKKLNGFHETFKID
jgi:hypothetical protein